MNGDTYALMGIAGCLLILSLMLAYVHIKAMSASYAMWYWLTHDDAESTRVSRFGLFSLIGCAIAIVFILAVGILAIAIETAFKEYQEWNDDRIIRSLERDVVNSCRRMTKVASRW